MAEKKRSKNNNKLAQNAKLPRREETFDQSLDRLMDETITAVVEAETYPRKDTTENSGEEEVPIFETPMERYKRTGRYEHSADMVARHMVDRTQFPY